MTKKLGTIVFFGSGPVASESLKKLSKDFEIEAVITKPLPAHHRGEFPVLEVCKQLDIKTLTCSNKLELSGLLSELDYKSRVGIVIDFGILIPEPVIKLFELGIINSHFSCLPKWRGADPISFAILGGDKYTGVSLMSIVEKLDEGPLIAQSKIDLSSSITTPDLTSQLIDLSQKMLVEYLPQYMEGSLMPKPQSKEGQSYSRKLTKQDSILDWNKPATELEREIRAFIGWPRSRASINKIRFVVTKAHIIGGEGEVGSVWLAKKELGFYTSKDILVVDRLIPEGKREMTADSFLAGYRINY
jgi:methionyl-tRNA formyltransferase